MVGQPGHASLIGRRLGNYAVESLLGRGAMGAVYRAHDVRLGRSVALKVLLGSLARSPDQVARFLGEARAAAPLQHPHIVGVYEAGVRDGTPFIAMEYVEGEALARFLKRTGPLDWRQALYVAAQVVDALNCAHNRGVVHRDVKPANILLDRGGRVRLTDFGIARMQQHTAERGQRYMFFGTPDYMSPEQCGSTRTIGTASDFFSLGVMLFEMMSGKRPFSGQDTAALVRSIVNDTPPRLNRIRADIPDDVARLVAWLLAKSPEDRPRNASAILTEIKRIQQHGGDTSVIAEALQACMGDMAAFDTPAGNSGPAESSGRRFWAIRIRPDRKRLAPISLFAKVAVGVLVLVGMLGISYWRTATAPRAGAPAEVLDRDLAHRDDAGRVWVDLPGTHWIVDGIQWVGHRDVALVAVRARPGTGLHGSRGVLAIEPDTGVVRSVSAPVGPMADSAYGTGSVVSVQPGAMPVRRGHTPLSDAFLVNVSALPKPGWNRSPGMIYALAQRWDEAQPQTAPLFAIPAKSIGGQRAHTIWQEDAPRVPAAIHPNGHTVCLVLHDRDAGRDYLVERDTRWRDAGRLGRHLTTTGESIDGGTLRYSDNGDYLAYQRLTSAGETSLWVIELQRGEPNGMPVATGALEGYAFSPAGDRLAVTRLVNDRPLVHFIDTRSGDLMGNGVSGRCGAASWHPEGAFLMVLGADDETGVDQLWALSTQPPYERTRLTAIDSGVFHAPSVSRSGRWVATTAQSGDGVALLFIPMRVQPPAGTSEEAV